VGTLREQARIYAGALGETAVRDLDSDNPKLIPELVRPLLRRLTDPSPYVQARVFGNDNTIIADSRVREGGNGSVTTEPLPPVSDTGLLMRGLGAVYDGMRAVRALFGASPEPRLTVDSTPGGPGFDWQPDVKEEIRLTSADNSHEMPPKIWRAHDNRLLVSVVEPVLRDRHTVGIIQLTREAREVDDSVLSVRTSILEFFVVALVLTVLLSWYLSRTIARPILGLAAAARQMREGQGRLGAVPEHLRDSEDEIGVLARALSSSAVALWARMDATERFAADVAHEVKNPLSSMRSAIETLSRIEDPTARGRLLAVINNDVRRLDRLITDISDASRLDAQLSRAAVETLDVAPMLSVLAEIAEATHRNGDATLSLDAPAEGLYVRALEDRLVQVLQNLIGNAQSFSPANGQIFLRGRETGGMVELSVEDEGPGIPEANLENVFERFYSERPKTERFGEHSGLGLSICRQIVEAAGGRISAENRRDEHGAVIGARFVVRLPRAG
jgi:two-component system sensor histidine kinase ChvG